MMATYHWLLISKQHRINEDPFHSVPKRRLSPMRLRSALFHNLADLDKARLGRLDDLIDPVEDLGLLLEKNEMFIAEFNEALQVLITGAQEF